MKRDTRIVAPVNGTIQFRRVQGGEHILRGTELFTLVRSEVLELTAALPARRANEVKPGQVARFLADGRTFTGRVARVSPTIDPASRSITAYLQIPNPSGELKGNTFSSGQIIAQTLQNVLSGHPVSDHGAHGGDRDPEVRSCRRDASLA